MSIKENYENYLRHREKIHDSHPLAEMAFLKQTTRYVEPFHVYGNLYYVGDTWVCAHIVDTGEGLLMIDAGNSGGEGKAMLIHSIWKAGFDPADIRWVILSHGHLDHIGAAKFMRDMFGTKLYLGEKDAEMFLEHPELVMLQDGTDVADCLFTPDTRIHDGDVLTFGNTTIRFLETPGHTDGVISCFFDVHDGKETKRVGYFGGFGFNTLEKDYLIEIGDSCYAHREQLLHSLERVMDETVDIFLPNHADNNDWIGRSIRMKENASSNAFVDPDAWRTYLSSTRDRLIAFMQDPANQ